MKSTPPPITAVIVEDEPKSRDLLAQMLSQYCPEVEVTGSAGSVDDAFALITRLKPSVVFLDIEMPGGSGFKLLEMFSELFFSVIFTTSYNQYAIQAIRFSALDYLLKPITLSELRAAVNKLANTQHRHLQQQFDLLHQQMAKPGKADRIALPCREGYEMVPIDHILFCESDNNYTYFHLTGRNHPYLVSRTLKECEELLNNRGFFRLNQSFLVNLRYVNKYVRGNGGYVVMENQKEIPVSPRKRDDFLAQLRTL